MGLRYALWSVKNDCVQCKDWTQARNFEMSNLPHSRGEDMFFMFSNCGVDCFGPFRLKYFRKILKKWTCLLALFRAGAVNLEVSSTQDMKTCPGGVYCFLRRRSYLKTTVKDLYEQLKTSWYQQCRLFLFSITKRRATEANHLFSWTTA